MKPIPFWGECGLLSSLISEQKLRVCGVPMVMLLLRGGAQRRNLWKMLMPQAGKFSPWIWIDQTLTHHCDSNKGTPLVGLRVYKKGNIFRPMMERQFDDIIIMSMFCILIHIIVPFQIFLSF